MVKQKEDNPHKLHRQRLKNKFIKEGAESLDDKTLLELLLFYALPRCDTRPTAAKLLEEFGSIERIANAPLNRLKEVTGIKDHTAILLKIIPELSRRFMQSESTEKCLNFFKEENSSKLAVSFLLNYKEECVGLLCLDPVGNLLGKKIIHMGNVNSVTFSAKQIVDAAYEYDSKNIILIHNHPNKTAFPSADDLDTTDRLKTALRNIGINLIEHYVVAGENYCPIIGL